MNRKHLKRDAYGRSHGSSSSRNRRNLRSGGRSMMSRTSSTNRRGVPGGGNNTQSFQSFCCRFGLACCLGKLPGLPLSGNGGGGDISQRLINSYVQQIKNDLGNHGVTVTPAIHNQIEDGVYRGVWQKDSQEGTMSFPPTCNCGGGLGWCLFSHDFGDNGNVGVCLGKGIMFHWWA